jgi:GDPmannose 4,6-dehydratase
MINMKKALVFGVTGQMGFYLTKLLLEKEYKVFGVVRRSSTPNTSRLSSLLYHNNLELCEGDITDAPCVAKLINYTKPDEVYNLAAQSHVWTSFHQPSYTWQVTAQGCLNILEAIHDNAPTTRFITCSSSEMYGDKFTLSPTHYDERNEADEFEKFQDEATPFNPQSPYAIAKLAAHQATQLYRRSYGLHASTIIMFNNESPMRGETFVTRKITKYIATLRKDKNIAKLQLGNLKAQRDWGFTGDYAIALNVIIQQQEPDDYVIATGETYTVEEFCAKAFHYAGFYWKHYVEIDTSLYRPSEVPYLCGKSDKARAQLGWQPKVSFDELVKLMVDADLAATT